MKKWQVHIVLFLVAGLVLVLVPLPHAVKDMLYKTYNLVLFLYIVCTFAAPVVKSFFIQRKERIEKEIAEAHQLKERAEELLKEYQEKIDSLEQEKAEILERLQQEGNREKEQIIKEAEEEAQRIVDQAKGIILQEGKRMRRDLREEAVYTSVRMAEELIREHYNQDDQKKAIEETLIKIRDVRL
ncbi:MAG: F0F1 ATP synthase subunit B [Deltaproteobacteria bacterium]|nr:F0F1 ATP synthase subunit B [Deltaproteobacteria bacterium]